ncbi:MAG: hypothetical protein AABY64_06625 [Bdellovibrionota bacterium]
MNLLITLSCISFFLLASCSNSKNDVPAGKAPDQNQKIEQRSYLKKSLLTKDQLNDQSVWALYVKDTDTYAHSAPLIVGFSKDNRIQFDVGVSKGPADNLSTCFFKMIAKYESLPVQDAGEQIKLNIESIEFVFAHGSNNRIDGVSDFDSNKDVRTAEEACFKLVTMKDIAGVFEQNETYPTVDFSKILSRTEKQINFGVKQPASGADSFPGSDGKSQVPKKYTYTLISN